jgi:hypothetical protein
MCFLQSSTKAKQKERERGAQSHALALESSASCKRFKTRATTGRASWAVLRSWGMSSIGGRPKSIRTPATRTSHLHSLPTSAARLPAIPCTRARVSSCSACRLRPLGWHRPCSNSSARITSCTPRSVSYRPRRIVRLSNIRRRASRHSD